MVTPAIINNLLGGSTVTGNAYALYVASNDVMKQPGSGANRWGTPINTVSVTEQGSGGVSSMAFRIEDPQSLITINNGDMVRFWDNTNNRPLFYGWVQSYSLSPFGLGRAFDVECIGIEALLDWMLLPSDYTITAGIASWQAIPVMFSLATAMGVQLNLASSGDNKGTQAAPIGGSLGDALPSGSITIPAGTTMRQAMQIINDQMPKASAGGPGFQDFDATIDFYGGVRWHIQDPNFSWSGPTDYANLTVLDTSAGTNVASDLQHGVDAGGVIRGIYIAGGNAAGTGLTSDGSGIAGPVAYMADGTILTAAARDAAAGAYLRQHGASVRGSFVLINTVQSANIRAGSALIITDAQISLSSYTRAIRAITKKFIGGSKEDWTIQYEGMAPSFADSVRALTRAVRS